MVELEFQTVLSDYKTFVFTFHTLPHWIIVFKHSDWKYFLIDALVKMDWNFTGLTCHRVQCGSQVYPKKLFSQQWLKDPYSFHLVTTPSRILGFQDLCGTTSKGRASHWWCLGHMPFVLVTREQKKGEYESFSFLGGRQNSASQHDGGFSPKERGIGSWTAKNIKKCSLYLPCTALCSRSCIEYKVSNA